MAQVDIHGMSLAPVLLGLRVLSILWAFWDPTWLFRMRVDRTLGLEARGAWVVSWELPWVN